MIVQAIKKFLQKDDFKELRKYALDDSEWNLLGLYRDILAVSRDMIFIFHCVFELTSLKVPHAFQQKLSSETTPTLCGAIPSYEALIHKWESFRDEKPIVANVIDAGLEKLDDYTERISEIPAYTLSMCQHIHPFSFYNF